jgi:rhodanese-related sulfurtransferase
MKQKILSSFLFLMVLAIVVIMVLPVNSQIVSGEPILPAHLAQMMAEVKAGKAQIFDVREEHEWRQGHLSHAQLTPLSQLGRVTLDSSFDRDKKTYLYCRSGNRVRSAAPLLNDMGFKNVVPLKEGFLQLKREGVP